MNRKEAIELLRSTWKPEGYDTSFEGRLVDALAVLGFLKFEGSSEAVAAITPAIVAAEIKKRLTISERRVGMNRNDYNRGYCDAIGELNEILYWDPYLRNARE